MDKELMCLVIDSQGEFPTGIISSDYILRKQFYESTYMLVWGTWQQTEVRSKKGRYQRDLSSATITENRPLPETPHRHLLTCSAVDLPSPMHYVLPWLVGNRQYRYVALIPTFELVG